MLNTTKKTKSCSLINAAYTSKIGDKVTSTAASRIQLRIDTLKNSSLTLLYHTAVLRITENIKVLRINAQLTLR